MTPPGDSSATNKEASLLCCPALQQIMTRFELPFEVPITVNWTTGEVSAAVLHLQLSKLTPGGRVSRRGGAHLVINFCPICGADLRPNQVDPPDTPPSMMEPYTVTTSADGNIPLED